MKSTWKQMPPRIAAGVGLVATSTVAFAQQLPEAVVGLDIAALSTVPLGGPWPALLMAGALAGLGARVLRRHRARGASLLLAGAAVLGIGTGQVEAARASYLLPDFNRIFTFTNGAVEADVSAWQCSAAVPPGSLKAAGAGPVEPALYVRFINQSGSPVSVRNVFQRGSVEIVTPRALPGADPECSVGLLIPADGACSVDVNFLGCR